MSGEAVTESDLYDLPEGTLLYKPQFSGWTLFMKVADYWQVADAFNRDDRGARYSPAVVGCHSPAEVIWQPPEIGYYEKPEATP